MRGFMMFSSRSLHSRKRKGIALASSVLAGALVLPLSGCGTLAADAKDKYPTKSIDYVIPFEAGGTTDLLGRQVGDSLADEIGSKVVYDNVAGSGGALGTEQAVTADPDGYTLGMSAVSTMTVAPLQNSKLSYQKPEDYTVFGRLPIQPMVLAVKADAPWDTMSEFVEDARKNPGKLSISNSGTYATPGLASYATERAADVEFNIVPYAGGGADARNAVLGGDADATIAGGPLFKGFVDIGDMKILGVYFDGEYPLYPDAPSAFDEGVEWEAVAEFILVGPPGLPEEVTNTVSDNLESAITTEKFENEVDKLGFIADYADPAETERIIKDAQGTNAELVDYVESRQ